MLSTSEQLLYTTVRIESDYGNGTGCTGTGFFFRFKESADGRFVPAVVTNKHVVRNAKTGRLIFCTTKANGSPDDVHKYAMTITDFEATWRFHPENNIDLCVMPIADFYHVAETQGKKLFCTYFDKKLLPDVDFLDKCSSIEDIIMIGYPNGLWDAQNNKPIFRRGITATDLRFDYNGKKEFVIDAACFPGSSGSPVIIYNQGSFTDKNGTTHFGSRVKFLGVLHAGPQARAEGTVVSIPVAERNIAISNIPNNLGYVIKAEKVMELENIL